VPRKKPYYLREPWEILFKDRKLGRTSPWSIDLVHILTTLLEEMNKVGIDFRIAGTAINSSVIIYQKKAELLLKMDQPRKQQMAKPDIYVPPALNLPFRFEFTTTSVTDLITALERALTEERRSTLPRVPVIPVQIPDFLDMEQYLLEVEERSEGLYNRLVKMGGGPFSFYDLVEDWIPIEVVRVFMMLLFLAQRLKVDLTQDEEETDILVYVRELNDDERPTEQQALDKA
jgi:chromatin segregation and condensation protein Rec8/ScpA/Scc1 (kleisin family)